MKKIGLIKKTAVMVVLIACTAVVFTGCKKNDNGSTETGGQPSATVAPDTEAEVTNEPEVTAVPEVTEGKLTDGLFEYTITNEGKTYLNYVNFYENGVFYYSKYNNGQYTAGYYTVVEGSFDIGSFGPISGSETPEEIITCDSQIIFYDLDGKTELGQGGYTKGGNLIGFTLQDGKDFTHIPDSPHTSEDETGVNMAEYAVEGDEYSMIAFKHNGVFQDTVSTLISGTWSKADNVYTLVNEASGKSYTLTDNGDGTATYKAEDGTETLLLAPVELTVKLELNGTAKGAYGDLVGKINCYDDGSLSLVITYAGSEKEYTGTWELAADYSKVSLVIDGETYEAPRGEDNTFSFEYKASDGTGDVLIPFTTAAK